MADQDEDVGAGNEVSIEDFEAVEAASKAAAAGPALLTGDDIPEQFRGKSAKEIAEMADRSMKALRVSEEARLAALEARAAAPVPVAPAAPPAEDPQEMTDEQFDALYEEDPKRALRVAAERIALTTERNILARMAPLQAGQRDSAEAAARAKYTEEFELLGDEIKAVVAKIPNQQYLSSPGAWDDVISFVRGKNIDKVVDARMKKVGAANESTARAAQFASAGFTATRTVAPAPVIAGSDPSNHGLDPAELKIADTLGQSPAEYARWKKMGN